MYSRHACAMIIITAFFIGIALIQIRPTYAGASVDEMKAKINAQSQMLTAYEKALNEANTELQNSNADEVETGKKIAELNHAIDQLKSERADVQAALDAKINEIAAKERELAYQQAIQKFAQIFESKPIGGTKGDGNYETPSHETIVNHSDDSSYHPRSIGIWLEEKWFRDIVFDPPADWGRNPVHIWATEDKDYYDIESRYIVIDIPDKYHLTQMQIESGSWIDKIRFGFEAADDQEMFKSFGRQNSGKNKNTISRGGSEILGIYGLRGKYIVNIGGRFRSLNAPSR